VRFTGAGVAGRSVVAGRGGADRGGILPLGSVGGVGVAGAGRMLTRVIEPGGGGGGRTQCRIFPADGGGNATARFVSERMNLLVGDVSATADDASPGARRRQSTA
jgi:hypothetical protein